MQQLNLLLASLDPHASLALRHVWLVRLLAWIRGDGISPHAGVQRVQILLDLLAAQPAQRAKFQAWWALLAQALDVSTLLADFGFAPRAAFVSELGQRLRRKLLPATPETRDAAELFGLAIDSAHDPAWLAALDDATLLRIGQLLALPCPFAVLQDLPAAWAVSNSEPSFLANSVAPTHTGAKPLGLWQHELLDAITYCAAQVRAAGFSPELRLRMDSAAAHSRPFHALAADAQAFCTAYTAACDGASSVRASRTAPSTAPSTPPTPTQTLDHTSHANLTQAKAAAERLLLRLEACRQAAAGVYGHLDEHGISVGLVFRLQQMRQRIMRIRQLLDCLLSPNPARSAQRLVARLALLSAQGRSLRQLLASSSSLLASKVAQRSAEAGEHYITRSPQEYRAMLGTAAGGGAVVALTTWAKFALMGLGGTAFWAGWFASLNYALSFVAIQLLGLTLATKQPAMTAPALASKLQGIHSPAQLEGFVDEVTHLVRSQVAAVLGNLALVVPCVLVISALLLHLRGGAMMDAQQALYTLQSLHLMGPTALFAAFTGVLLFASSIIAGWVENWFVLHRLDSALRYNPRISRVLGAARAARWAQFWRRHISGFAANVSLGLLLGMLPAFLGFLGLGIEVRHVTLSAGQIAAAAAALGWQVLGLPALWWSVAAIPVVAFLNLAVSFYCAFRVALAAQRLGGQDRARIRQAIWQRLKSAPWSFLRP